MQGMKVKILIVQNSDWLVRNPAQNHHLAEMLSLRGHEIRVIDFEVLWRTRGKKEFYSKRKIFSGVFKIHKRARVTVIRPGFIKIPLLDYFSLLLSFKKEIDQQIKEFTPDVIIGFSILAYLAGKAARRNHIPFVYYWIDVSHRLIPFKFLHLIGWMIERGTVKLADKVLTINEKLREFVIKIGASYKTTEVLRAGIDFKRFDSTIDGNTVRKQYGFAEEDIVLFFMGWLYQFSGLKEVASQLIKFGKYRVKLLIVGEGDAYSELQQIREELKLRGTLVLTGQKPYSQIPSLIAASDICLLPAYPDETVMHDIVPIKMYEYLAMGKPVVATRLKGVMREFGENGGVVYVDKPEDVIRKVIELDSNRLKDLKVKAIAIVKKYSWDNITDEFERILREVIDEKKKGITRRSLASPNG